MHADGVMYDRLEGVGSDWLSSCTVHAEEPPIRLGTNQINQSEGVF